MKKRFATYLLGGKAATLPLLPTNLLAEDFSSGIFSRQLHLVQHAAESAPNSVRMLSEFGEAPGTGFYGGVTAAQVVFPGQDCTGSAPSEVNLVVTGLSSGEDVFIFRSRQKDDPALVNAFPGIRVGLDLETVAYFGYYAHGAENGVGVVSVPVELNYLGLAEGESVYLQAATGRWNDATGTYENIRFSELDLIEGVRENCNDPYGNNGGTAY